MLQKKEAPFLYDTFIIRARLEKRKSIKKTLLYYNKALENAIKIGSKETEMFIYKELSDYYVSNNINDHKSTFYLYKYQHLSDSLDIKNKELIQLVFDQITNEKNEDDRIDDERVAMFFFITLFVAGLFWYLWFRTKKKILNMKEKTVILQSDIEEVGNEIDKKQKIIEELEQKVSNTFSELNNMVKENSPLFWGRFQEVYPNFSNKMLEVNPTLKISELTFCSYIYLGFSNKEIAEYTFRSIRTVENNRYNLRKKMNLSTEEDFTIWVRKHVDF